MNNYFRLLFVGTFLFVLIGLFDNQSENPIFPNAPAGKIAQIELQAGLLPVFASVPNISCFVSVLADFKSVYKFNLKDCEILLTIIIWKLLNRIELEYTNRKPLLICKTGQYLHLPKGTIEPSIL